MSANKLADETSPYLLQHKDNPVHWRPWNKDALAEAQAQNKPIMLSVGYAACHWCHVMAHESFEDEATAARDQRTFHPDKGGSGRTPGRRSDLHERTSGPRPARRLAADDVPYAPLPSPSGAGTYFPKQAQWGRPGFVDVLRQIARIHEEESDKGHVECHRAYAGSPRREQRFACSGTADRPEPASTRRRIDFWRSWTP